MERQPKHMYKNLPVIGTVLLCILLLSPSLRLLPVGAQTQSTSANRDEFDAQILTFFEALKRGSSTAFDELLRGSSLGAPEGTTQLNAIRTKLDDLPPQFGNILAWEKVDVKRIGTSIALVRYVLMYERYPIVWTFSFYRRPSSTSGMTTTGTWVLVELHFETDLKKLL